jgi:hypothetical protein
MKNLPMLPDVRNRERGAVAVVVAFAWTALFGMAVLAIDFGYLYAKRRGVQAVADAALRSAMPIWSANYPSGFNAADTQAKRVTSANLYSHGVGGTTVTSTQDVANNLYTVTVTRTYPTFIGGIFGLNGKTVSGRATGRRNPLGSGAAIHALNNTACPGSSIWGLGFQAQGGASLIVNGTIESNTQVFLDAAAGAVTGTIKSPCTPLGTTFNPNGLVLAGETAVGAPYPDPINVTVDALNAFCTPPMTVNNNVVGAQMIWTNVGGAAGCDTIPNLVYCSNTDIIVTPSVSMSICPNTRATFITRTRVIIGANDAVDLQPATGAPNNLVMAAYDVQGSGTCGANTINMGTAGTYNLQGNVYAPNGCVWIAGAGAVGGFRMTGQMVGRNIALGMSPGPAWIFTGPGGGGGGAWTVYQ